MHMHWGISSYSYSSLHESEAELRKSVINKDILRVWWGLTGFHLSALIYHVFLPKQCIGMHVSMF